MYPEDLEQPRPARPVLNSVKVITLANLFRTRARSEAECIQFPPAQGAMRAHTYTHAKTLFG